MGKGIQKIPSGHVVKELNLGGTTVRFCDDSCVKTQEEIDAILDSIAAYAIGPLNQAMMMEKQETKDD